MTERLTERELEEWEGAAKNDNALFGYTEPEVIVRLIQELREARKVLKEVEYGLFEETGCPWCGRTKGMTKSSANPEGHKIGCRLKKAIGGD